MQKDNTVASDAGDGFFFKHNIIQILIKCGVYHKYTSIYVYDKYKMTLNMPTEKNSLTHCGVLTS